MFLSSRTYHHVGKSVSTQMKSRESDFKARLEGTDVAVANAHKFFMAT